MSAYIPTPAFVEREYVTGRLRRSDVTAPEARAEFARMIAEVERAAAARALEEAANERERLGGLPNGAAIWLRARAAEIREKELTK